MAALWSDWNTKVMEGVILFLRDSLEIVGRGSPLAKSAISNKDMDTVWVGGKNKSCSALLTNYALFSSSSRLEAPRREVRVSIWNTRGRELETQQAQKKKKELRAIQVKVPLAEFEGTYGKRVSNREKKKNIVRWSPRTLRSVARILSSAKLQENRVRNFVYLKHFS